MKKEDINNNFKKLILKLNIKNKHFVATHDK